MSKFNSLRGYLAAPGRFAEKWGWKSDYEQALSDSFEDSPGAPKNWAWLAGYYGAMVDDLIDMLGGPSVVLDLLSRREAALIAARQADEHHQQSVAALGS